MQGPNLNDSSIDLLLRTQRPVEGWKINLWGLVSDRPGPAFNTKTQT